MIARNGKKIISGLLVIGMSVQIILGMIWIATHFANSGSMPESVYYKDAAFGGVIDEYMGILYPVIYRICCLVMAVFGVPGEWLLYGIQLICAWFCYSLFIKITGLIDNRDGNVILRSAFGGLYLLTVPLCVQWHLCVLPRSLTGSLFLLMLGMICKICRSGEEKQQGELVAVIGLWAVLVMLHPDNLWLGLVPVIYLMAYLVIEKRKKAAASLLLGILVACMITCGLQNAVEEPGGRSRIQRSVGAAMASRMFWPHFGTSYHFLPDEVKDIMTLQQGVDMSQYADSVQITLGPLVENAYGREKADALYWQMAVKSFGVNTKQVVIGIWEDFLAYFLTPWQVSAQFEGQGISYSGWNYNQMMEEEGGSTGRLVKYGLASYQIGIVITVVVKGLEQIAKLRKRKSDCSADSATAWGARRHGSIWLLALVTAVGQALWYTMSGAGMMDYGNVTVISLLWYSVIVFAWSSLERESSISEE